MSIRDLGSIPQLVRMAASTHGPAPALQDARRAENELSYEQLLECTRRGASALCDLNLAQGERVLLIIEACPQWAAALFSILEAGLIAVPVPSDTGSPSIAAIAAHTQAKAAVLSDRTQSVVPALGDTRVVSIDDLFRRNTASNRNMPEVRADHLAIVAFTSGSTQQPRAVELTHANLLHNLDALLEVRGGDLGDALLSMLPPAHLFELTVGLLAPLACGARVVYAGALLPNRIVEALRQHEITHALAVSALVSCLYEEVVSQLVEAGVIEAEREHQNLTETARRLETEFGEEDLRRIRDAVRAQIGMKFETLVVGGAALDPALARVISAVGFRVEVGYGLTETSPVVSLGLVGRCPAGSVGRPLPSVNVKIADDGEILVQGPNVMRGYFRDAEATAAALQDGWLKTGDRGRLDGDGYLFVTGRIKEAMVTAAGETIYPEEIEPYYQHPLFAESCVSAVPGTDGNDLPTLFVVPAASGHADEDLNDALANLRAAAPPRFRIRQLIRLSQPLPRTATGKIRRRILTRQFQHQLQHEDENP